MTNAIKPFRATYYDSSKVGDLSNVVCPPYDVITKEQLLRLRKKSPYNYSNINLAKKDDYKRVAATFNHWVKKGIFVEDDKDNLYLYGQQFKIDGKYCWRYGVLSLLRINRKGAIFPHEHTHSKAKIDRMKMTEAVKANLSPIFVIAPKAIRALRKACGIYSKKKPFLKFIDDEGNKNHVWKIEDKKLIAEISSQLDRSKMIIADGHHRFEVSQQYFKDNKKRFKDINYCLAYIADAQPGLVILPIHRIVKLKTTKEQVLKALSEHFSISVISQKMLEKCLKSKGKFAFGLCMDKKYYFLKLKNEAVLDKMFKSSPYRKLDTYVLKNFVFQLFDAENKLEYANNLNQVKSMATKGKVAFIMRPAELGAVCRIANKGHRLPQKSTYFYPKVGSGVVVRRFVKT
ncbi:MAG: DUF1015 domain-containing protein [Candidatus Omnitrophica bacterium]|nr:DUF1015 domain-containing protein [Candidatus Omnitrophota bacterium]